MVAVKEEGWATSHKQACSCQTLSQPVQRLEDTGLSRTSQVLALLLCDRSQALSFLLWQNPLCLWGPPAPWLLWKQFTHSMWFFSFPYPPHTAETDADHSTGDTDPCINRSVFLGLAAMWDMWNYSQIDGDAGQGTGVAQWDGEGEQVT